MVISSVMSGIYLVVYRPLHTDFGEGLIDIIGLIEDI